MSINAEKMVHMFLTFIMYILPSVRCLVCFIEEGKREHGAILNPRVLFSAHYGAGLRKAWLESTH